jgi:DNA-directed RNA polymerase subunit K/omega
VVKSQKSSAQKATKEGLSVNWKKPTGPAWLTKYEKSKILGIRARQLMEGAEPLIEVPPNLKNPLKIAELELEHNKLPFLIKRVRNEVEEHLLNLEELDFQKKKPWEIDI